MQNLQRLQRKFTRFSSFTKHSTIMQAPSDPCPTDLDRILTEGQDPGAQQYLVLGTVPIKGKNLGFWVPMHLLY